MFFSTFSTLKDYIYTCGVDSLKTMGIECFPEQIRDALLATDLLKERYTVDLKAELAGTCKGIDNTIRKNISIKCIPPQTPLYAVKLGFT